MVSSRIVAVILLLVLLPVWAGGCGQRASERPVLTGRALLPADTFAPGPPTGASLTGIINGRTPPFAGVPVQGFSSLIPGTPGEVLVLQDNGFGNRANSAEVPLRWYRLGLDMDTGIVDLREVITLADPDRYVPFTLRGSPAALTRAGARALTLRPASPPTDSPQTDSQ